MSIAREGHETRKKSRTTRNRPPHRFVPAGARPGLRQHPLSRPRASPTLRPTPCVDRREIRHPHLDHPTPPSPTRSLSSSASLRKKERESRFDVIDVADFALALGSRKFHTVVQVAGRCHVVGWTCAFGRARAQVSWASATTTASSFSCGSCPSERSEDLRWVEAGAVPGL